MSDSENPFDRMASEPRGTNDNPFDRNHVAEPEVAPADLGGTDGNPFDRNHVTEAQFAKAEASPTARAPAERASPDTAGKRPVDTSGVGNEPSPTTQEAKANATPRADGQAGLRSVDLTGREKQLREAMAIMARISTTFARLARRSLPFLVWRKSHLLTQSVAFTKAPGAGSAPEGPALHALYEDEGGNAWACVSLNAVSLALIVEGALGGAESKSGFSFGNELTLAQRALASRMIKALGDDLVRAMCAEVPLPLKLVGVFASPTDSLEQVQRADGLSVDCTVEGVPGALITVAVQAAALEAVSRDDEDDEPQAGDPRMVQIVQEVPVEVVAELGRLTMGLRSVLKLQKGQVLRLSTAVDDPVRVEVAGLKKFSGVPVVSRGQLAVEIRGRHGD